MREENRAQRRWKRCENVSDVLNDSEHQREKGTIVFSTDWISFSLPFSHFLFPFFLYRVFKINHKRYTWIVKVIYLILCSKIFKNYRKQLYQRTVHKSFQKIMFLPSPCNDRPKTAAKSRSGNEPKIVIDEKKGGEIEKGKKEKKNLMDACTHDRGRASSAREGEGTTIRYPGNRCPGPVVA